MFEKHYSIKDEHVDFQGVVDGLYYPFYMEWCRHAFMKDVIGLDIEKEFEMGHIHMILEYTIKFKKSLKQGDNITVTCEVKKADKKNRVMFIQQILVEGICFSEATFLATCLVNGRPSIPNQVIEALTD